jgi:hypothetical protein
MCRRLRLLSEVPFPFEEVVWTLTVPIPVVFMSLSPTVTMAGETAQGRFCMIATVGTEVLRSLRNSRIQSKEVERFSNAMKSQIR